MLRFPRSRRAWLVLAGLLLLCALLFLATSDNATIWPVRNTLFYHATRWWAAQVGSTQPAGVGALHGCVHGGIPTDGGAGGVPLANAAVIVAERDGVLHQVQADSR